MANQLTIDDAARGATARKLALAVAAAAGSQALAFPAAAQGSVEVSAACKMCAANCGQPIFYPEDGGCPNPIFYPESMIAIGVSLIVGVFLGGRLAAYRHNRRQQQP